MSTSAEICHHSSEKMLNDDDLRELIVETVAYVMSLSEETAEWISPTVKDRMEKLRGRTSTYRLALLVLLLLSMIVDFVGLGQSFSNADSDDYRTLARFGFIIGALFTTLLAFGTLASRGSLQRFAFLNIGAALLDSAMMALVPGSDVLFITGIVAIGLRVIVSGVGFGALDRHNQGSYPEEAYLFYLDTVWNRDLAHLLALVHTRANIAPGSMQREEARKHLLGTIAAAMEDAQEKTYPVVSGSAPTLPTDGLRADRSSAPDATSNDGTKGAVGGSLSPLHWLQLSAIREVLHDHDRAFTGTLIAVMLILGGLSIGNVAFEFWKVFANQPPIFTKSLNDKYNDRAKIRAQFANRSHDGLKVHVVVVDGLRDDFTDNGASTIGDYLNGAAFAPSSLRFHARGVLPSFSVPNWITLLTGAPPEDTGVTGNLQNGQTSFDNIYSIAREYGVHTGMTGTPWWALLVADYLPPLGGDGTIATSFVPKGTPTYDWTTADPADHARGAVAVEAARRSTVFKPFAAVENLTFMYQFFLTHFSDVDGQGHEYGIDTKWNTRDSYRKAVANKTKLIQNIVDVLDNDTILIVTSDHGHVMRGGHGGSTDVLRDVPLFFYRKGASLTMPASANFLPSEAPRKTYENKYTNMDLAVTICALLGLPTQRQALGVFIEEAVQTFVPAGVRLQHYHDLLLAKISLVQEYDEYLHDTFFESAIPTVLTDTRIKQVIASPAFGAVTLTERDYADLVRVAIADHEALRNTRFDIVFYRNMVLSIIALVFTATALKRLYDRACFLDLTAVFDRRHPVHAPNAMAAGVALLSLTLYIALSIITYLIIYFAVVGQTVWDTTAFHTPSVAIRYVVAVIVSPIIYFTVITKVCLARAIEWRVPEAVVEAKALRRIRLFNVFKWISHHFVSDVVAALFTTRQLRADRYPFAHLYIQYLTLWVALLTTVLLFMCFPFSFFLPAIFSVSHVSAVIIPYRFRLISVLFMLVPMQLGCIGMLWARPRVGPETLSLWDRIIVEARIASDMFRIEAVVQERTERTGAEGDCEEMETVSDDDPLGETIDLCIHRQALVTRLRSRLRRMARIASWLSSPSCRVVSAAAAVAPNTAARKSVVALPAELSGVASSSQQAQQDGQNSRDEPERSQGPKSASAAAEANIDETDDDDQQ